MDDLPCVESWEGLPCERPDGHAGWHFTHYPTGAPLQWLSMTGEAVSNEPPSWHPDHALRTETEET